MSVRELYRPSLATLTDLYELTMGAWPPAWQTERPSSP